MLPSLSQEPDAGVNCNLMRGLRFSQAATLLLSPPSARASMILARNACACDLFGRRDQRWGVSRSTSDSVDTALGRPRSPAHQLPPRPPSRPGQPDHRSLRCSRAPGPFADPAAHGTCRPMPKARTLSDFPTPTQSCPGQHICGVKRSPWRRSNTAPVDLDRFRLVRSAPPRRRSSLKRRAGYGSVWYTVDIPQPGGEDG
jgi:hypothetical protein